MDWTIASLEQLSTPPQSLLSPHPKYEGERSWLSFFLGVQRRLQERIQVYPRGLGLEISTRTDFFESLKRAMNLHRPVVGDLLQCYLSVDTALPPTLERVARCAVPMAQQFQLKWRKLLKWFIKWRPPTI